MTFTTLQLPDVTTGSATSITASTATLEGSVNAKDISTTVSFEYGLTTSYGSEISADESPVTGSAATAVSADLSDLTASTTYHYRVKAVSAGGTTYGDDMTFTTLSLPAATTETATKISSIFSTLHGTVNANDLSTTVTFEYGLTTGYGTEVTADESPVTGTTTTAVSYDLTGLTASTTYHYRVKAVSAGGTTYGGDMTFATTEQVSDADGNTYNTVQIGTQLWIQENLKTTHYNNNAVIANITDNTEWDALTSGAYCWYDNDETTYKSTYGALYNWYTTVDVRNVCPAGWHVPSDAEWTTLTDYLGGESIAGGKLKESGTDHWTSPNTGASNETVFTALPGGFRHKAGTFSSGFGNNGCWWSSTRFYAIGGYYREMDYNTSNVDTWDDYAESGRSVRCIKGELPLVQTDNATAVTSITATLKGKVNPNGASTVVSFEYGETTSYGSSVSADQSPVSGSDPVDISAGPTSLTPGTTYHYRIKAENSYGTNYGSDMEFTTPAQITDGDGNIYNAVQIGTQVWMKENLRTTKYKDGTEIPLVTDNTAWSNLATPGYCWYNNDATTYKNTYGALYNWYTVNTGKLCPTGWHVPTDAEWTTLTTFLGGAGGAGGKLKEAGTTHWLSPNTGATNETGFTALPGGRRSYNGTFDDIGSNGYWWSATESTATLAWGRLMGYYHSYVYSSTNSKEYGFSVRCVRD